MFFFHYSGSHLLLHSFPTRRPSDLDLGKIDTQGYVHIVGRGKDLVISGGFNVYPKEIESEIDRSEEHTSELQSRGHLVCRLLLEKKNLLHERFDIGKQRQNPIKQVH